MNRARMLSATLALSLAACSRQPPPAPAGGSNSSITPSFDVARVVRQVTLSFRPEGGGFTGTGTSYDVRATDGGSFRMTPRGRPPALHGSTTGPRRRHDALRRERVRGRAR